MHTPWAGEPDSLPDAAGDAAAPNGRLISSEGDTKFVALEQPEFSLDSGSAKVLQFNRRVCHA